MLRLALKPKLLQVKNSVLHPGAGLARRRFFIILLLSVFISCFSLMGSASFFAAARQLALPAGIEFYMLLQPFITLIFGMIFLSSCIAALHVLFASKNLELFCASPLTPRKLLTVKTFDIFVNSIWMLALFCLPPLIAMSYVIFESATFFFWSLLLILPFILLPVLWSITLIVILMRFVPLGYLRVILFAGLSVLFALSYGVIQVVGDAQAGLPRLMSVARLASFTSNPLNAYLPSHWLALGIGQFSNEGWLSHLSQLGKLYGFFIFSAILTFSIFRSHYPAALARALDNKSSLRLNSRQSQSFLRLITPCLSTPMRALLQKELKLFARDITQTLQFLILTGLCLLYLYNFKSTGIMINNGLGDPGSWHIALLVINLLMAGFIITAICTRFVFTSISMEGQSFWIINSAPISTANFIKAKFKLWFIPVGLIACVVFTSGAMAIQVPVGFVIVTALTSWVIVFGIVGLAIGFGCVFSQFDWEHASQLSASLGGLAFMLVSMTLVMLDAAIALVTMVYTNILLPSQSSLMNNLIHALGIGALLLLNFMAYKLALRTGLRSLQKNLQA